MRYALPAWGVFMSAAQSGRIDAFLKRAHKCGFFKELLTVNELLVEESGRVMFKKMKSPTHCLHMLLPPNKKMDYNLRNSESYVLPQCTSSTYKRSFVNWCLFDNSIYNSFVFIVSIFYHCIVYARCHALFHARLMREFNKV